MLDLCSGLGGASEAFHQAGWTVIRIENNPDLGHIPFTFEMDVLDWELWIDAVLDMLTDGQRIDVIWASPPCVEFSRGYNAPGPVAERAGIVFHPCMDIVEACFDIINHIQPKHWCIENVGGAVPYFEGLLGEPSQTLGPFYLWGNFPQIITPRSGSVWQHCKTTNDSWSTDPLRANKRAYIPFELSFAFMETLGRQWTLDRWDE